MNYKKILTIQDISCLGQCSLTVALPILSACGMETCIIPSAILSTHTAGFSGYTFHDLTEDIPRIKEHWLSENIKFEAIYTGYLGSKEQIDYVRDIMHSLGSENCVNIVDPAMADNGKLYPAFDLAFVTEMKTLTKEADYLIPNITEACFLTDSEYKKEYDEAYIKDLCQKLISFDQQTVILTGVSYRPGKTGVVVYTNHSYEYYEHDLITDGCHGTGDVYASAFVGALMREHTAFESARIAADYTVSCIKYTQGDKDHWYGVKFEPVLPELIQAL